ncbi:YihY/virulence factor BrkB family protein [Lichenihabitans sp. Uapishka_5]|uniref:YihY/virulence factor BrkB family protein n=1 Tax=Lichenihabitans sp. Uapishka_5 TaxID=3037302 RepID=UPI0029E807F5|nr:YihY/virulence factor BrkB family protein [Lichenihabitans sp. Uapishka_5]MDX7952249.1 YihY/virulence factor BrkB family protein [Lichenihabitans sp. Uapishka_5]
MDPSPHRSKPEKVLRIGVRIVWDVIWRFSADDGWAIASHIALTTLTSLFPFLIFMTALAGLLGSAQLAEQAATLLFDVWPAQVAAPIAAEIHNVLTVPRSGIVGVGAVLAVYFSSSGVEAFRVGLNRAYGVREKRPWWLTRLESIVVVLLGAVASLMLAFLVVLAPLLWSAVLAAVPGLGAVEGLVTAARYGLVTLTLTIALLVAHKWLPAERRTVLQILPGIALTFVASLLFSMAFGRYLQHFARNYASTYGGLASVMIALVFLYTMATIFVIGGELNAALIRWKRARADARASEGSNVTRLPPRSRLPRG